MARSSCVPGSPFSDLINVWDDARPSLRCVVTVAGSERDSHFDRDDRPSASASSAPDKYLPRVTLG